LACALRREEAKVARVTRRLEAQEGDLLRLAGSDAARACDKEARGRLSLIEERLLSQEAALKAVSTAGVLELKGAIAAIESRLSKLSDRPRESEEVAGLRSSLAAVERENARLASELAGVASAVSSVREQQESESAERRDLEKRTEEGFSRQGGEIAEESERAAVAGDRGSMG